MLKEKGGFFQQWVVKKISFLNVEPNHITLFSVVVAFFGAYYIFKKDLIAIGLVFFAFFLDFIDGALAREKGKTSSLGAYLDGISDRIVEFFLLSPFLFFEESKIAAIILLFFGTFMHAFSKAYSDHRKLLDTTHATNLKSFFGRAERSILIIFSIMLFLINSAIYVYLMWIGAILSVLSFLHLQLQILKHSKKDKKW